MRYIIKNFNDNYDEIFLDKELFSKLFKNNKDLIIKSTARKEDILIYVENYPFKKLKKMLNFRASEDKKEFEEQLKAIKQKLNINKYEAFNWIDLKNVNYEVFNNKEVIDNNHNSFVLSKKDYFNFLINDKESVDRLTYFIEKIINKKLKNFENDLNNNCKNKDDSFYLTIDGDVNFPLIDYEKLEGRLLKFKIENGMLGVKLQGEEEYEYIDIQGPQGEQGLDGVSPHVTLDDEFYLVVDNERVGESLKGPKGDNGETPEIGFNSETNKLTLNGEDFTESLKGDKGDTPDIGFNPENYKLTLDGIDFTESLKGDKGDTPNISLNEDGFLVIDDEVQNVNLKGDKGEDGHTPIITIEDGILKIDGKIMLPGKIITDINPIVSIDEDGYLIINGLKYDIEIPLDYKTKEKIFYANIINEKNKYTFTETIAYESRNNFENFINNYEKTEKEHKAYIITKDNRFYGILTDIKKGKIYSIKIPNSIDSLFENNKIICSNALTKEDSIESFSLSNVYSIIENDEIIFYIYDENREKTVPVSNYISTMITDFKGIEKHRFFTKEELKEFKKTSNEKKEKTIESIFNLFNLDRSLIGKQ